MRSSAPCTTSSGKPAPSFPTSSATGSHQSTSQGHTGAFRSALTASCTQDATVFTFRNLNCVIQITSDIPSKTGKCKAAPAEARIALGENGLAVPPCLVDAVTAPVAPNAAAVLNIVPTFPGSFTPASTTTSGEHIPSGTCNKSSTVNFRGCTNAATP